MAVEVSQLKAERNFDGASVRMFPLSTGQFLDVGKAFESRISTVDQIMESLIDPTVHAIGLYGFGGVGKTTSARQAAKKAQEGTLFDIVILAGIKNSLKEIQSQIADILELELDIRSGVCSPMVMSFVSILFHAHAPTLFHILICVIDCHCTTWEANLSLMLLEDIRNGAEEIGATSRISNLDLSFCRRWFALK